MKSAGLTTEWNNHSTESLVFARYTTSRHAVSVSLSINLEIGEEGYISGENMDTVIAELNSILKLDGTHGFCCMCGDQWQFKFETSDVLTVASIVAKFSKAQQEDAIAEVIVENTTWCEEEVA
jgi:hypothetical protein